MRFCVQCGAEREGSTRFCTACGGAFPANATDGVPAPAMAPPPPPPTVPQPPRAAPRQLRCVSCGSAIDMGLTCAACSRENLQAPVPVPPATAGGPAAPSAAPRADAPKPSSAPSGRWVGALAGMAMALAAGVGHWANRHPSDLSRALARASPFGPGLDGVYDCSNGAMTATLRISGTGMDAEIPGLLQIRGTTIERHGSTITIRGGAQYDGNGYLVDAADDGRSMLGTVGDDGQSITIRFDSTEMRFVKR